MYQLKTLFITILLSFIANALFAQADLCDNCYVWEFTTEKGERDQTTRLLSNDIEDILSSYAACKVLQRSKFAKLLEQINNEKAIESLSEVKPELKTQLKAIQAKRVIFGEVNRDFTGNVSLRLSFDNLISTQTRTNTVFLIGDDYYNFEKRKQKLTAFINSFVNPDGKMTVPGSEILPTENNSKQAYLVQQTVDGIKITVNKFEQAGNNATFYFTLENMTPQNQVRNVHTRWNFNGLTDQDGNEYKCKTFSLGNQNSEIDLIFQTPVKCFVQFEAGAVKLTKAAKLKIGGYNYNFQFINLKL